MDSGFDWFSGGVIISCQAPLGSPLRDPYVMTALARAAEKAGASGIRAEGNADIRAIVASVLLPVIGIRKQSYPGTDVFITPTRRDVDLVADAGAQLIAMDGTARARAGGEKLSDVVAHAHDRELLVMADLAAVDDAAFALDSGADSLATTLIGQSLADLRTGGPNVNAVAELRNMFPDAAIVAEGRYATAADVRQAIDMGATSVVVGTAVTDAYSLARHLIEGARVESPFGGR
jgi:N-acylglucosamine-6-phosphate 2-epimerase